MIKKILHSDHTTVFTSRSGHFDLRFQSEESFLHVWPDVVDFANRWGCEIYAGSQGVPIPIYAEPNCIEQLFWITNQQILNGKTMYHNNIYSPKVIWYDGRDHTPMIGVYYQYQGQDCYQVTKGTNKCAALHLRQDFDTPVLILSHDGPPPGFDAVKINTDSQLLEWLISLGAKTVDHPYVEFMFLDTEVGLLPGIHHMGMRYDTHRISNWEEWIAADTRIWHSRGRQVLVQIPDFDNNVNENFHATHKEFDSDNVSTCFAPEICAAVISTDPAVVSILVESLVWLGTDHLKREVGTAISEDGLTKIVYNSESSLTVKIPPGLICKNRYTYKSTVA